MTCPENAIVFGRMWCCTRVDHHARHGHFIGGVAAPVVEWQKVLPPERKWQPGDIVKDAGGRLFTRRDSHDARFWVSEREGYWVNDFDPKRPLTRLVPEVTS